VIIGHRWLELLYLDDHGEVKVKRVTSGSRLDRLRQLATFLAHRYGWHQAQAATFVLTGVTPLAAPIRVTYPIMSNSLRPKMILEVDFLASGDSVGRVLAETRGQGSRRRRVSARRARLAAFMAERPRGETRRQQMHAWHRLHDNWPYPSVRLFARDARAAPWRLLSMYAASRRRPS
jgi:hypothetical protein